MRVNHLPSYGFENSERGLRSQISGLTGQGARFRGPGRVRADKERFPGGGGARGFSLFEALLSLMILSLVVVSFLGSLTEFHDMVRVQGDITEASEDLRHSIASIVRQIRMTGAGGLPLAAPQAGGGFRPLAVDVADNVPSVQELSSSAGGGAWGFQAGRSPVEGTDALRIRGVMTTPRYGLSAGDFEGRGRCAIPAVSPWTGLAQDLNLPGRTRGRPFLFALQAPQGISTGIGPSRDIGQWRVVEVTEEAVIEDSGGTRHMNLVFDDGSSNAFASLNAVREPRVRIREVFSGGFLDDFVFLVSKNGFGGTSLYRLRVTRGDGGRVVAEEMAPNVVDFQVALGCDLDCDGRVVDEEWFLSRRRAAGPSGDQMVALSQVRLSIVTRTQRPDRRWSKGPESHENGPRTSAGELGYRYRAMTVRVSPRIARTGGGDPVGGLR